MFPPHHATSTVTFPTSGCHSDSRLVKGLTSLLTSASTFKVPTCRPTTHRPCAQPNSPRTQSAGRKTGHRIGHSPPHARVAPMNSTTVRPLEHAGCPAIAWHGISTLPNARDASHDNHRKTPFPFLHTSTTPFKNDLECLILAKGMPLLSTLIEPLSHPGMHSLSARDVGFD
jgi:hypothetical protein